MKTCRHCNIEKPLSEFVKLKTSKDGHYCYCIQCNRKKTNAAYHKNKILKPKVFSITKVCGSCKEEFPKNGEFFFTKTYKQKLANGETATYQSFRSTCKKCHGTDATKKNRKKRCKELGCTLDEYKAAYLKQMANTKSKYNWIDDNGICLKDKRTLIRYIRNGYEFTTYEAFLLEKERIKIENFKKKRVGKDLNGSNFLKELSKKDRSEYKKSILSDSKIANWLGMKVADCPKGLIEVKRLTYKINRLIEEIE